MSELLKSGYVRRWHSNAELCECGENNAQHQWHVAMIALTIYPEISRDGLLHALTHDVGELYAGDLNYMFKVQNPEEAKIHEVFEVKMRESLVGRFNLTNVELQVIKISDWISAWNTMRRYRPDLSVRSDWVSQLNSCKKMADEIGINLDVVIL